MKWIVMVTLLLGVGLQASATNCYYMKDLPENLKSYRDSADRKLYETQGTYVVPKNVAGCDIDTCVGWVKCDNGPGRPWIKTKVACAAVKGRCPSAQACMEDPEVTIKANYPVVPVATRSGDPVEKKDAETSEGVE